MKPLVYTKNLSREDWLNYRRIGIGGSEIAALIGESPWSSPFQIYLDKVVDLPEDEQTEQMYFGNLMEPVVADEFARRTGLEVKPLNFMLQDDTYEYMLANVDRVIEHPELGRGLLECKNVSAFKLTDWENERVPSHYYYQVQWYLGVTEYPYAYIAAIIGGNTFRYTFIKRNESIIKDLRDAAIRFWTQHIIPKIPPEVSFNDKDALSTLYPKHEEQAYHLSNAEYMFMSDLLFRRKMLKEAEDAEALAKNRLMSIMQTCDALYYEGEKMVSWRTNVRGSRVFKILVEA